MEIHTSEPAATGDASPGVPAPLDATAADGYQAGVCNIGPAEVAARRRAAIAATLGTAAIAAVVVLSGAPREARLLLGIPIAGATVSWLQVRERFCVAYAVRGVENVARPLGAAVRVAERGARRADLRRAAGMAARGAIPGIIGAAALWLLPR